MSISRNLYLVGTAGVAFVAGVLVGRLSPTPVPTLHRITVSGDPAVAMPDPVTIYASKSDIVNWTSDPPHRVGVLFKATNFDPHSSTNALKEPPFEGGTPGVDQTINCAGGSCTSLNINPKVAAYLKDATSGTQLDYKYWQSLDGKPNDGKIIIKW